MRKNSFFSTIFIAIVLLLSSACKDDDNSSNTLTCTKDYDQTELLTNMVEHIIIPSYQQLGTDFSALTASINSLVQEPTEDNLEQARVDYITAYKTFQYTAHFQFGPAVDVAFRENLNNFPPNIDAIHNNLNSEIYDFNELFNAVDADQNFDKGFPALDYLLYGYDNLLVELESDTTLQFYLYGIISNMKERWSIVHSYWITSISDFVSNQGTDAGSSLSLLINAWNENYELAKRQKLGDPAGVNTLNIIYPKGVEAYYSGISLDLLQASLQASQDIYEGIRFVGNENGEGLADLLEFVEAQKDGTSLHQIITSQFATTQTAINAISGNLSTAIESDNTTVRDAYAEYSKQVLHTKTDMPSILCISITYVDNPSDSD